MENQHRLIKTYRELSPEEIDLMNRCKAAEATVLELQRELLARANADLADAKSAPEGADPDSDAIESASQAVRSASVAKTELQTGFMWLVRSVARPAEPAFESEPGKSDDDTCCAGDGVVCSEC